MKKGGFRLYYSFYCAALLLATLLLWPYQLTAVGYMDAVLYAQLNLMLAFPLFTAVFVLLKLTAFMILGNVITAAFQAGDGIRLIRYGVIKYYILQMRKVTGAVALTTFGSMVIWCILTSSWSFPFIKIVTYIMLLTSIILLLNLIRLRIGFHVINLISMIFICAVGYFSEMVKNVPVNAALQSIFFCMAALFIYGIANIMLLCNIRKLNYL